jgi:Holliday junction resolvase RusA-like endonuclease
MRIAFAIPGPPVPKARARVVAVKVPGKKARTRSYTPDRTANYQSVVAMCALSAYTRIRWDRENPKLRYGISLVVHRSAKRGDWDNFGKAISDACNGILWVDDRQILDGRVRIEECEKGREHVEVEVWTLD